MFKLCALLALVACSMAAPKPGFIGSPLVASAPVLHAPAVAVAAAPLATSYANTYKVSVKSPVIAAAPVVHAAPYYAASPLAYHAPLAVAHHAPLAVAHSAPFAYIH